MRQNGRSATASITSAEFFLAACDGKFTDEDLNDEGNAFADAYFDFDHSEYPSDYERLFDNASPALNGVGDTWDNYDLPQPVLDARLRDWRANKQS